MGKSKRRKWGNPFIISKLTGYDSKYITIRDVSKMTRAITFGNVLCKARIAIAFLGVS
jgi:hypothetical protein